MEEMKPQLAEYLMSHGVLKGADAQVMAQEIVDMLGVEKLKAQLEAVQKANAELREFALTHFSREQVKPLLEAVKTSESYIKSRYVGPNWWSDRLASAACGDFGWLTKALAHARAVGMEEI